MIEILNLSAVKSAATDSYQIYWEARRTVPAQETVGDFIFKILWSEAPNSGFTPIRYGNGAEVIVDGLIGPFFVTHNRPHSLT